MNKKIRTILSTLLIAVLLLTFLPTAMVTATPKIGEPLGDVLYSDITAYIDGNAIPTSVIKGKTLVIVEDLKNYGFDVAWNSKDKSLKVELNKDKICKPLNVGKNTKPVGTFKCKYLYTDIKTYLSGQLVESFAIDGVTLIDFELLAKYGKLTWNGSARTISLSITVKSNSPVFTREDFADGFAGTTIVAGEESSFAIKSDGTLWAWGNNAGGRLGDGTVMPRHKPVKIMDNVASVHNFGNNTMAITTDGSLYSWGVNDKWGILGNGTTVASSSPTLILDNVVSIQKFSDIMMAITADGSLWAWGSNSFWVISPSSNSNTLSPIHLLDNVVEVFSTGSLAIALTSNGGLWTWGLDTNQGRLGQGRSEKFTVAPVCAPAKVLDNVTYFTYAADTTFAITKDYGLWAWGHNYDGRFGNGTNSEGSPIPVKIFEGVAYVSMLDNALINATMAVTTDGRLWAWGSNENSLLGDGTTEKRNSPMLIMNNVADVIPIINSGNNSVNSVMAITTNGELWGWGANRTNLALGDGTTADHSSPIHIMDNVVSMFSLVNANRDRTTFTMKKDSSLWGWGHNASGRLGDGTAKASTSPVHIMDDAVYVFSPFENTTMAISSDGNLWGWGSNQNGQLGDGTTTDRYNPIRILTNVVDISYSSGHMMVITADGNLWAWGNNRFGQLGDDTATTRNTPVRIMDGVQFP